MKSLNSKQLDLQTRIAPLYREKEMEIRQMVSEALLRGKVDFSLWIEKDTIVDATPVNGALMENYYRQLKDIAAKSVRFLTMKSGPLFAEPLPMLLLR